MADEQRQIADDVRLWAIPHQMALAVIQMGHRASPVARAYADAWMREYDERAELILANARAARIDGSGPISEDGA